MLIEARYAVRAGLRPIQCLAALPDQFNDTHFSPYCQFSPEEVNSQHLLAHVVESALKRVE